MNNKAKLTFAIIVVSLLSMLFHACGDSPKSNDKNDASLEESFDVQIDTTASKLIIFNNVLFSIPSPYQFAFFIRDLGISFNKEYLNKTKNSASYTTTFKKALNLGVYGTDLGYLNIYEQTAEAINYFSVLKMLSQDVGISNIFNVATIERIESNMGNKDSLLYIISNKYREADAFLKENDRNEIAVLILAGGWIESLHILSSVGQSNSTKEIQQKIAEQKHSLENLINILQPYYRHSNEYKDLIDQLIELAYVFDGVDYKYEYKEPETDPANKITTINSLSELTISDKQIKIIRERIYNLRSSIIK